jgi:hypothetical protein
MASATSRQRDLASTSGRGQNKIVGYAAFFTPHGAHAREFPPLCHLISKQAHGTLNDKLKG